MAGKYARKFIFGHDLLLEAHSFPRVSFSETLHFWTDNVCGHIFAQLYSIVLLHSDIRMSAFLFFGIRWLTYYDRLWSRDLTDEAQILQASQYIIASLRSNTASTDSVFKIRKDQLTCWLVKNEFWGQKHGYETDDLKGNFQLEVFDWESKSSSLSWSSWIHISFFQQLLFESISSVVWQIVSISGEKLKAKGKTQLLANHLKIFTWGYLRVAHKETHTVNNILVTASQFFKLSKLIGMCNINFFRG